MATPNRKKNNSVASVLHPFFKVARIITPTGIGVLLSIGAHAALIAYGPRTNFSFAALTQENLEANPEETIVPIVQLSGAERNRLPSFAQPRRPPADTGLSSLQLPSGLPSFPSNRSITRRPVPSQPIPSPITRKSTPVAPLNQTLPNAGLQTQPFRFTFPTVSPPAPSRSSNTALLPTPTTPPSTSSSPAPSAAPSVDENGLPVLAPNAPSNSTTGESQAGSRGLSEALRGTESANIAINSSGNGSEVSSGEPAESETVEESGTTNIPVENSEAIAVAPAAGDPALLLSGSNMYSNVGTSDDDAQTNLQAWLASNTSNSNTAEPESKEITIDSDFKACREVAPVNGLIGVLVNPDGSRENIETLKSTGYGSLNSLALSTLEYEDFGQPEVPTLYKVNVNVVYEPSDCVEELPEVPAETSE